MFKFFFIIFMNGLFLTGCFFSGQPQTDAVKIHTLDGKIFGSTYNIKYVGDYSSKLFQKELEDFFNEFNREFSTYDPNSVITKFNQLSAYQKLKVSNRFIEMLKIAQRLHQETQGAFDPTLGPIIKLWGFGGAVRKTIPSSKEIQESLKKTGLNSVHYDEKSNEVWKSKPGLELDLNAFAPGWAADLIGEVFKSHQIHNFMIDIGGEILVRGQKAPNSSWVIGIEKPSQSDHHQIQVALKIKDMALATSGNYRQFFDHQGQRKSHIIDPRTGSPVEHSTSSATVMAPSAVEADAWGTALMVLGEKGLNLAGEKGYNVYLLQGLAPTQFKELTNPQMKQYLLQNQL